MKKLKQQSFVSSNGPNTMDIHYYIDDTKVGKIEIFKSRRIIFQSELFCDGVIMRSRHLRKFTTAAAASTSRDRRI